MAREVAAERRRQILDAAVRVFARQGFHSTRVADIADEADVVVIAAPDFPAPLKAAGLALEHTPCEAAANSHQHERVRVCRRLRLQATSFENIVRLRDDLVVGCVVRHWRLVGVRRGDEQTAVLNWF